MACAPRNEIGYKSMHIMSSQEIVFSIVRLTHSLGLEHLHRDPNLSLNRTEKALKWWRWFEISFFCDLNIGGYVRRRISDKNVSQFR